jgi:probable H4MPT-linked C1 transfer pathway protein
MKEINDPIVGWDIGGANIKAVRIGLPEDESGNSRSVVIERFFPLWREPQRLSAVLIEIARSLGDPAINGDTAITMTAELADCFANKSEGVGFVLDAFQEAFPNAEPQVYGVDGKFRSVVTARAEPLRVAAANWMASATIASREFPDAIFLDVGSTTTDIIPILAGEVAPRGRTDSERLATGELVYTGILRTPLCAIVRTVPVNGQQCRVAAEHFAVAADVHLWLGQIEESDYTSETPDGKGRSRSEVGARLARTVCADFDELGENNITAIAEEVARVQISQVGDAIRQVLAASGSTAPSNAVLAGHGAFLARAAAEQNDLNVCYIVDRLGGAAGRMSPAAAVAYLLADQTGK